MYNIYSIMHSIFLNECMSMSLLLSTHTSFQENQTDLNKYFLDSTVLYVNNRSIIKCLEKLNEISCIEVILFDFRIRFLISQICISYFNNYHSIFFKYPLHKTNDKRK